MQNITVYYIEGRNANLSGIKVTIKSLLESSQTKIIVLYKDVSEELIQWLSTNKNTTGVDCTNYKVRYATSPYNNKILYTFLFLKNNSETLNNSNVFVSDLTDFYFELDPFSLCNNNLVLTKESKHISNCEVNTAWLNICYGTSLTDEIKNNTVLNGGFVLGSYQQVFEYYSAVIKEMQTVFSKINYPIVDQCIMNKIVYKDNYPCHLSEGAVNHLSQTPEVGIVKNKITHQYKVREDLKLMLYKKYE